MARFGVAVLALFVCFANPANAIILFVCGGPLPSQADITHDLDAQLLGPTRVSSPPNRASDGGQIALTKDEDGYDIVMHYGDRSAHSLRNEGADILATSFGDGFVHLMVSSDGGATTEHFIFAEEHDGLGNLAWGKSPTEGTPPAQSTDRLDHETRCVLP